MKGLVLDSYGFSNGDNEKGLSQTLTLFIICKDIDDVFNNVCA